MKKFVPSMNGPGDGDRLFGHMIASGSFGAATATAIYSHQTNERDKMQRLSEKIRRKVYSQNRAISTARRQVKAKIWSKKEGEDYLESEGVSRESLKVGCWSPLNAQAQQPKAYEETFAEIKARNKASNLNRHGGGHYSSGEEEFWVNTVSVDPSSPVVPEPSFSRSAGWGALAAVSLFVITRVISYKIRANRSSNKTAGWLYSAFSPSSEKLIDFSEETDQSFEILNEKLDKASVNNTEIIRLLTSIDQKLG